MLRPGGAAYVRVHLYTSHSGAHDPTIMASDVLSPPYWPHLRPALRHTVEPSTYLNRLSLGAWRAVFEEAMPGVTFFEDRQEELAGPLRELREQGELAEYADEELLTLNLTAVWKKPALDARGAGDRRLPQRAAAHPASDSA